MVIVSGGGRISATEESLEKIHDYLCEQAALVSSGDTARYVEYVTAADALSKGDKVLAKELLLTKQASIEAERTHLNNMLLVLEKS